ncbi:MAG: PIN domain nuclease [Bacteroidia bacterium]|nr:MAG: PIN domain nuclease [Bacteroidia bacterium]
MKRIFIDTNIMLDFLGERHPYYTPIAKIATLSDRGELQMVVSPISFATVNYLLSKYENPKSAIDKLPKFKVISEISIVDEHIVEKALNSSFSDFEDALQYFSATASNCDIIITRNAKDFRQSLLPVMSPDEFLNFWKV